MLTPSSTPNQIRSIPSFSAAGPSSGIDDEGQLEEVEEEGQQEHQDVDDDEEADLAAGQRGQQVLDPEVAVDAVERQREDARADQDEDDEGRELAPSSPSPGASGESSRLAQAPARARPTAPMAPPSVGVAMPRKIVPSTRKISASGGIQHEDHLPASAGDRVGGS